MLSFLESKIVLNNIFGGIWSQILVISTYRYFGRYFETVFLLVCGIYDCLKCIQNYKSFNEKVILGGPSWKPYAQKSMETSFDT